MDWNGVFGPLSQVLITALPLLLVSPSDAASDDNGSMGPGSVYWYTDDKGVRTLCLGNFYRDPSGVTPPLLACFSIEADEQHVNESWQINYGDSLTSLEKWIEPFVEGRAAVGVAVAPAAVMDGTPDATGVSNVATGLFTCMLHGFKAASKHLVKVNADLTVNVSVNLGAGVVAVAGIGAAAYLGNTYLVTASNNAGQSGTREGALQQQKPDANTQTEDVFYLPLPTGVDFEDGVDDLTLQLELKLSAQSNSTDASARFITLTPEAIEQLRIPSSPA